MVLGGFKQYYSLREELLVLNSREIFVGFFFVVGIEEKVFLVQSIRIAYELHRKMSK